MKERAPQGGAPEDNQYTPLIRPPDYVPADLAPIRVRRRDLIVPVSMLASGTIITLTTDRPLPVVAAGIALTAYGGGLIFERVRHPKGCRNVKPGSQS